MASHNRSVPAAVARYQRRMLGMQRAMFENTFNAMVTVQEQQQRFFDGLLEQAPGMPDETRALVDTWRKAAEDNRMYYRRAVERSFDHLEDYLDRLADPHGEAEPEGSAADAEVPRPAAAEGRAKSKKPAAKKAATKKRTARKKASKKQPAGSE